MFFFFNFIVSDNDECSLPGWLTHGKIWKSLDMKLTLEITWDQVRIENLILLRKDERFLFNPQNAVGFIKKRNEFRL